MKPNLKSLEWYKLLTISSWLDSTGQQLYDDFPLLLIWYITAAMWIPKDKEELFRSSHATLVYKVGQGTRDRPSTEIRRGDNL